MENYAGILPQMTLLMRSEISFFIFTKHITFHKF